MTRATSARRAAFAVVMKHEGVTDEAEFAALWDRLGLDKLADEGLLEAIIRRLNGGLVGADDDLHAKWQEEMNR